MEQAEKLCDHIALLFQGRVVLDGELAEIKRREGAATYRLAADGDLARCEGVAGIEQVVFDPQVPGRARLFLDPAAAPAAVLRELVGFLEVRDFRSEEPELEEIFVKVVRDAA
jgi:ABC-2 type transport system ATP-binding protein